MPEEKSILVVEDELSVLGALTDKLKREGFNVYEAKNGADGLRLSLEKRPDLILLDLAMPKMDGIEMMRRLREENVYGRQVPIVILTNLTADDKITWAVAKDEPAYYLIKSDWKIEDVVAKVRDTLGMK
jgi:CheY-like chemotaxis protein